MEDKWIYFVEICDYEACWYTSVWDDEDVAREHYDNYVLSKVSHEQEKRLGKRKLNTDAYDGEYFKKGRKNEKSRKGNSDGCHYNKYRVYWRNRNSRRVY